MANAVSYMRNVTKSVKYSAIDSMKKMNPVITSFYDSNQDIINETYRAIKDIKSTTKSQYSKVVDGEVGGLAKTYFRNLMEDAKSGKFYNKERKERDLQQASIEFSGLDDMDFGIEFDDEDITFDDDTSNTSSITVNDIDSIAAKSTSAVGQIMARSTQYQVEAQRQTTKVLYDQNAVIFGHMHSSLGVINSNVGMIFNYMKENTNTHYENSKTFYENTTSSLNQTNEILKEMLELQKKQVGMVEKSYSTDDRVRYSDLFTAEGALDIKEYIRLIKQNIKDKDDGTAEMMKMMLEPGMLKTFTSSPLQGITDAVVKMITPKVLKDAFGDFNKSLSGFFGSLIMKLSQDDSMGIMGTISEYLGFKSNLKKKFDTSNYNKGVVPFDGVTRKAIIDVIPTYLSKIYSAISNTNESRFDYERGQFVTVDSLKNELRQMFDQSSYNASMDIQREFDNYSKAFSFKGDQERQDQFKKDMKLFFDYYFKNAKLYDKKLKAKDYGMTSKYSEENLALFQKMWEMLPSGLKMQYASNIMDARETFNRRMESTESDSLSPLTALFDGSLNEHMTASNITGSVKDSAPKKGKKVKQGKKKTSKQKDSGPVEVDESVLSRIYQERMDEYHEDDSDFSISGMFTEAFLGGSKAIKGTQKALNKPASMLSSILRRIDTHLYTFIFGDDKFDADAEDNGMLNAIFHKIQDSFDRFNIWIDQNVLLPLRGKFNKEKIKDATKSFFGMFGVDIESIAGQAKDFLFGNKKTGESGLFTDFNREIKSGFKGIGSYIKQSFVDVGNYFNVFGKKNAKGEAKSRKNKIINDATREYMRGSRAKGADQDTLEETYLDKIFKADDKYKDDIGIGSIDNAAEGIKRVSKTGVIVASEGEMIIPPDRNPFNIARRYRNENKAKDKFISYINNYAEGGTVEYDKDRVHKNVKDGLGMKESLNRDDYEDLHLGYKVVDELKKIFDILRGTVSDLTGKAKDKINETGFGKNGFSDALNDVMSRIKEYAPDMVVGGSLGAGISLLTGAIGGPLLGAASGAAISLIKNSDKVQNWLFGEMKDGERQGGILKKELSNNIQKYMPDMAKGATVGAITSIMPFVPGGPVAGIIIGSSIGFAKNNEKIQNALFGEEGLLGKDFPEKVKKTLPKMGAGAVLGLVGGPFGVATNVVLGSAIGFATETQTFQKLIFGEEDAEGNRDGGLLGMLKESVIEPNKQFFGNMFKEFREWFNTDIKDNVNKFIGPMQQDIKNLSRNLYRYIAKKVDGLFDKFLQSAIGQKLDKAITGINNIFQGTVGKLFGFGKGVVSLPFKALGRYGDSRRTKQIKTGNADMMSAAERVAFRNTDAFKKRSRFYRARDQFADVDTVLANMNNDEISSLFDNVEYARDAKKKIKNDKRQVYKNLNSIKDLRAVEPKTYKMLVGYVEDGNIDQIEKTIDSLDSQYTDNKGNVRNLDKKQLKESLIKNAQKFKRAKDAEQSMDQTQQTAMEEASKVLGVDFSRVKDSKLYDYLKEEAKVRGVGKKEKYRQEGEKTIEEMIDDKQQERHTQVVDLFEKANYYLRMIVDDDFRKKELGKTKESSNPEENKETRKQLPVKIQSDQTSNEEIEHFEGDVVDEDENLNRKPSIRDRIRSASNKLRNNKFVQSISNAFSPMVVHAAESENQQEQFLPAVQTEFYQGKAIKYTKSKDGSYNPDKSDSETVEALAAIDEDKQTQKGILGSLTSLPGKFFSLFGAKEGDEQKDKKDSIFSKLLKNAIKVAGFGALIAFAPKIYDFYNENIKPHITDFIEGFKAGWNNLPEMFDNGTGKIGQLFGDKLHDGLSFAKDWMSGSGQFEGKGFPYLLNDKIVPNVLKGFEWLMGNVVPKAVEIIAKSLPSIIWSGVKGLGSLIGGIINKDDNRSNMREDDGKITIDTVNVGKRSNELNYEPSNAWSLSGSIGESLSNITTSPTGTTTVKALDKATTTMGITSERRKQTKSVSNNLPKAFSYTNKYQQQKALDSYNQVKDNVITVDGYGDMSVSELLNRDDVVIATTTDKNGNTVNITGADILNYPDIAAQFGIDSRLTSKDLTASTKEVAGSSYGAGVYDGKSKVIEAGARAFASGRTGKISSVLSKVGNALSKSSAKSATKAGTKLATGRIGGAIRSGTVASVKKAGSVAATSLGKGLDTLSDLGARYLPSGIVGTDNKTKAISSAVQKMTSRGSSGRSNSVLSAVKGIGQKIADTSLGKKVSELGSSALNKLKEKASQRISDSNSSLMDKLVKKVKQLIPDMFTNSKLVNWVKNFMSEASEKLTASALEDALKTFGEKLGAKVASKLGQQAGKLVGKVATKAAALVGTAGLSTIVFAVTGFISGWRKADQLLNISEPTFLQKVISGAAYAINDTFCFGLIPLEDLFDFALDIAQQIPVFSGIVDNIKEQQAELTNEVQKYNMQNGTELTVDEYLDKQKKEKSIISKAGNAIKSAGNALAETASGVVKNVKSLFTGIFNSKKTTDNIDNSDISTIKTTSNEDAVLFTYSDLVVKQSRVFASPLTLLAESGEKIKEIFDKYLGGFKKVSKTINSESNSTIKSAENNDLDSFWGNKNSDTSLWGTFTSIFTQMQKVIMYPVAFVNNLISTLTKPFQSLINKVKSNPIVETASDIVSTIVGWFNKGTNSSSSSSKFSGWSFFSDKDKDKSSKESEDESEESTSLNGSGSGLLHRIRTVVSGSGAESNKSTEDPYYAKPVSTLTSTNDARKMKQEQLFVSQTNNNLSSKRFNTDEDTKKQTVADTGCAPAVSTMAINLANRYGITSSKQTFSNAIKNALNYKVADEGVTADYFIDEFGKKGMSTAFISSNSSSNMKESIVNMLKGNKPVVLMGTDPSNTNKRKSPFGPSGHYVLATGISDDGKYIYINDPESRTPNIKYPLDSLIKSVSLGMAAVKKNTILDNKIKNSKVTEFLRKFRGRSLTGNSNEEKCWNFFISQGFSEAATAGVMGNIYVESHFEPSIHQYPSGPGRGLCQWEASSSGGSGRYDTLVKFANEKGKSWDDLETQLQFVIYECTNGTMDPFFKLIGGLDSYMKSTDVKQATKNWLIAFELCGTNYNFNDFDINTRQSKAEEFYARYTGTGTPGTLGSYSSSISGDSGSTAVSTPAWQNPKSILDLYSIFDDLATIYGVGNSSSSVTSVGNTSNSSTPVSGATVSNSEKAELQRKMAQSFIKSENNLKTYSQVNRYNYKIADDGTITGTSADCSSLAQGVYKKFLNVDPGSWTGQMLQSSNTYTVEKGTGSPGSAPTESKLQLGDLVVYGPSPNGSHVEMYVGDGKTMGHGSAPGPHYALNSTVQDGKVVNWHSQNKGLNEVRRWTGFQGEGSGLLNNNKHSRVVNIITKNGTSFRKIFSGRGTNASGKSIDYITSSHISPSGKSSSRNILSNVFGNENTASNVYDYTTSTGSDVYATISNTTNNTVGETTNSAQLVDMLKAIVRILVKLVDNSENMKQIVSLLTQLVTVVSTTNSDSSQSKTEKAASAATIKANLLNTINTASKSNPDKELIDIINNMEALAGM